MFAHVALDTEGILALTNVYTGFNLRPVERKPKVIAPTVPAQKDFVTQWKAVTHYFLEHKEHKVSVEQTSIPTHLGALLRILGEEEVGGEGGSTGPCMEYLLQCKILHTLFTLARADRPPGMKQAVLLFYTKLLSRISQPLLPHINVHRPVQRLVKLCGETLAAPSEVEEIHFLCTICGKLCADPYLVNFFIETNKPQTATGAQGSDTAPTHSLPLIDSLLSLMHSPDARVSVKACEGIILCASLPETSCAKCLTSHPTFCQQLTRELVSLYNKLPKIMDPADIYSVEAKWGLDPTNLREDQFTFPGKRSLISFLSWLDYCDQLIGLAHPDVATALAARIHADLLQKHLGGYVSQPGEAAAITATAHLTRCLRLINSPALLSELVEFVLGESDELDLPGQPCNHKLRQKLLERCDHISDELSLTTLKFFEVLLSKPHPRILNNLVLLNLSPRGYMSHPSQSPQQSLSSDDVDSGVMNELSGVDEQIQEEVTSGDPDVIENSSGDVLLAEKLVSEKETDLNGDACDGKSDFSDSPVKTREDSEPQTEFQCEMQKQMASINEIAAKFGIEDATEVAEDDYNDFLASTSFSSVEDSPRKVMASDGMSQQIAQHFLTMLPEEIKSCQPGHSGYDMYLRDAHRQMMEVNHAWSSLQCQMVHASEHPSSDQPFYEGAFIKMLLDRLSKLLDQSYEMNLQVTCVLSRLALLPHPLLTEYLLNPALSLASDARSLTTVLTKLTSDVEILLRNNPDLPKKVAETRQQLLGLTSTIRSVEEDRMISGIIVLEEFTKELAAIAYVKYHSLETKCD